MDGELRPSPVPPVDAQVRGLSQYHHLRPRDPVREEVLQGQPVAVFLLHGPHHVKSEPGCVHAEPLDQGGAVHHGGRGRLVVRGSSAVQDPFLDARPERIGPPRSGIAHIHRVDVGIEDDVDRPVADPSDHAAQAVDDHVVVAEGRHLVADPLDHGVLPPGQAGCRDEVGEEPGHPFLLPATLLQEPLLGLHGPPFTLDRGRARSGRLASSR